MILQESTNIVDLCSHCGNISDCLDGLRESWRGPCHCGFQFISPVTLESYSEVGCDSDSMYSKNSPQVNVQDKAEFTNEEDGMVE